MTTMRSKFSLAMGALAAAGVLWAAGAQAQAQPEGIARLKQVTGNVLVSRETGMATGRQEQRLTVGTRIITTASSEAIVEFDNGCEVRVRENERFDVESGKPCQLLVAYPLAPVPVAAIGPGLLPTLLVPGGAGALLLGDRGPAVSPN